MAPSPKFSFDMIDAAGYGYHRVWQERAYLLRLAIVPFVIKFVLELCVYGFGFDDQILRAGLITLPGTFVQGWVLGQFLRTLLMEERWPQALPKAGDELAIGRLILRARGIISSTLVYVLIMLIVTVLMWGMTSLNTAAQQAVEQQAAATEPQEQNPLMFFPGLIMIWATIMAFPLLWIYIPYSVLMPVREYLERVAGFFSAIRLLGLSLVCVIPLNVLASVFMFGLIARYADDTVPVVNMFLVLFIKTVVGMVTALIATTGMTYALRDMLPRHPAALADVKP